MRKKPKKDKQKNRIISNPDDKKDQKPAVSEDLAADVLIEIRQHPFTRSIGVTLGVILLISAVGYLSYLIIDNPIMPVFVILFFVFSMASFFFPSRYVITKENLLIDRIIYRKTYPWARFRSYKKDKNGIYLSPLLEPDSFDRFRGIFLHMDKDSRERLMPILEDIILGRK